MERQEEIAKNIQSVVLGMEKRGIRFYVFEAPSKERIYGKYMPESIDVYGPKSRLDTIIPKLQEQGLPVYDLADSLRKYAEDYQVFYKYDTHWNMLFIVTFPNGITNTPSLTAVPFTLSSV